MEINYRQEHDADPSEWDDVLIVARDMLEQQVQLHLFSFDSADFAMRSLGRGGFFYAHDFEFGPDTNNLPIIRE